MTKSALPELRPCPFCGGDAYIGGSGEHHFFVGCIACFCNVGEAYDRSAMPEHMFLTADEAAAAWNLRLSSERDEMVERARKLVDKLDACREPTAAIFAHQYVRTGVQYSGPTYFNELEALRSLLSKPQEGAMRDE